MSNAAAITKLRAVLASGVLTVEADGRRVTYQSAAALRAEITRLEEEDRAQASAAGQYATTLATFGE